MRVLLDEIEESDVGAVFLPDVVGREGEVEEEVVVVAWR